MRRPRRDRLEIVLVARDGCARRLGPDQQVGVRAVAALCRQHARDVHERLGLSGEVAEAGRPVREARRGFAEAGGQGSAGLIEMGGADGLGAPVVGEDARGLLNEPNRVLDSRERLPVQQRPIGSLATGIADDQQMTGEVPAVDGGHVAGLQRAKVARVIPVVEVAPEALEGAHGRQRRLESLDGVDGTEPAEIARGERRQQVEPDVGRRRAARNDRLRVLLEIVGRQEVIIRPDEGLEEPPGAARRRAEDSGVPRRQDSCRIHAQWPAHPSRHQRRHSPEQDERRGDRPALWPHDGNQHPARAGQEQGATHPSIRARHVQGVSRLGLGGGRPFEHRSAGQAQADERPRDRIGHQPRLMSQAGDAQRNLGGADRKAPPDGADVSPLRDA